MNTQTKRTETYSTDKETEAKLAEVMARTRIFNKSKVLRQAIDELYRRVVKSEKQQATPRAS